MEINTIHILEFAAEKIPTDSDKIRQTKAEQGFTPKILQIMLDII